MGSGSDYYVLFEDPDGIRLEVNFVPGAGVLQMGLSSTPPRATSRDNHPYPTVTGRGVQSV